MEMRLNTGAVGNKYTQNSHLDRDYSQHCSVSGYDFYYFLFLLIGRHYVDMNYVEGGFQIYDMDILSEFQIYGVCIRGLVRLYILL